MTSTAISPKDYQQIKRLVAEYLQLSTYAQPTFLSQIAASHPRLIETIKGMVDYTDQDTDFILDTLPIALDRSADIEGALLSVPDQDKFKLQQKLSYGGYSQVYQARQVSPVKRDVAIKFLNRLPKQSLLLAEAEFLASLNHHHIATLYEFGETTDGRLFIVMELVPGLDLISYAETEGLSIAAKIALFKQLCSGIAHAHEKGIIHCDIKPSNVLVKTVNGEPVVKIIDFGVSKYQRLSEDQTAMSGTPAYMAPETLKRKELLVDTRNDVYSMGVLLHRLLCGAMPAFGADQAVSLNADLQAIINRAMHPDRAQRYGNSMELFDDLNRHLNHEVVKAREPSLWYGFSRFLLKYKLPAVILLLFVLTVATGFYAQSIQATAARNAQQEAEQVTSFVIDLLSSVDPEGVGEKRSTVELVLQAQTQLLALAEPTATDARFMYTVGEMLYRLDRQTEALELAKRSLQLRQQLSPSDALGLLQNHTQLAKIFRKLRQFDAAKTTLLAALELQQAHDPNPRELSFIHNQLGNLYFDLKDNEQSIAHHELALAHRLAIDDKKLIADSLNNLGAQYYDMEQWQQSGDYFHRSLKLLRQAYGPEHAYTYFVINNLATIEENQFNWTAAEDLFKEAVSGLTRIYGEHHFNSLTAHTNLAKMYLRLEKYDQAIVAFADVLARHSENQDAHYQMRLLGNLGTAYTQNGEFDKAREQFEQGLSIGRSLQPTNHFAMALIHLVYGQSLRTQGHWEEATSMLNQVILHDAQHDKGRYHMGMRAQNELAHIHREQGDWQRAVQWYQQALQTSGTNNTLKKKATIQSHIGLAKLHQAQGDLETALSHLQQAQQLNDAFVGPMSKANGEILALIGDLYQAFNQPDNARAHHQQALDIYQRVLPPHHSAIGLTKGKLN